MAHMLCVLHCKSIGGALETLPCVYLEFEFLFSMDPNLSELVAYFKMDLSLGTPYLLQISFPVFPSK